LLQAVGNLTDEARRILEEMKIEDGGDAGTITSWNEEIENKISLVDNDVDKLAAYLTRAEQRETEKARQEQLEFEKEVIERKFRYHKELEEKDQQDSIFTAICHLRWPTTVTAKYNLSQQNTIPHGKIQFETTN